MVDQKKRDFLYITSAALGSVGAAFVAWPFLKQLAPSPMQMADRVIDVNLDSVKPGMSITVKWMGKPVFIRNRTEQEIAKATLTPLSELKDKWARNANLQNNMPATDLARSAGNGYENWLIMIGICTHLGCVPVGEAGEFGGWFCPCHGSVYDTAGRIRSGPAPENMHIPPYYFISKTVLRLGETISLP